jgi:hypothetical protein
VAIATSNRNLPMRIAIFSPIHIFELAKISVNCPTLNPFLDSDATGYPSPEREAEPTMGGTFICGNRLIPPITAIEPPSPDS